MKTEDLAIDQSSQRQIVKQVSEKLPYISISILAQALVIESIYLRNLTALMVTSENGYSLPVPHLSKYNSTCQS